MKNLETQDNILASLIKEELKRQQDGIELIASENFVSEAVMEATGSILTNKYAEGYPSKRYYGGCEVVDKIEDLARERAKALFGAEHVNVQPHSGSQANAAVYFAVLEPGDTILGMNLSHGGHLTHGSPVNFSGITYNFFEYGVEPGTEVIDYDKVMDLAKKVGPKMIVAGASAYSRTIDFKKFKEIADQVGAYLLIDMAHIAGLVATGLHPNPVPYADFVTTTTHKTLRGPRGGMILCKKEWAKQIDKAIFPGTQGGPLLHVIAGKAVALQEASTPEFKTYIENVVKNANTLSGELTAKGIRCVSGGTDNHLVLLDVTELGLTGKEAEKVLGEIEITVNKNTIPFDTKSPFVTSGIRIGTAAVTTRGFDSESMVEIADIIANALKNPEDEALKNELKIRVLELAKKFPLYKN